MGAAKKYFKNQFQVSKFKLGHDDASDFYLACWQRNFSPLPLLFIRAIIFLACLGIILTSLIMTGRAINLGLWFIYLTHWGLTMITLTSGLACYVSWMAYTDSSNESSMDLPMYVKVYWEFYNVSIPLAFFITIYYFIFLSHIEGLEFAINPVLDVFIHGINSVLMLLLLVTSRVPSQPLHVYQPICFTLIYIVFTVIYYFSDGRDPFGNSYIYPTLDWAKPGTTILMIVLSALAFIVVHLIVVGIAVARDTLTRHFRKTVPISDISYSYN